MISTRETRLVKDLDKKKLFVTREFDAPVEKVWNAWTEVSLLDQWWAPKPWKAHTVSQDFSPGGVWLYYMQGPDGSRHYAKATYEKIENNNSFSCMDAFCDEKGNIDRTMPTMHWKVDFFTIKGGSRVEVEISFNTIDDLQKILETGFQEGFTAAHSNLDELLAN
jgi:uncharacterized protein YndB with AHSA1/START domain